MDVTALLNGNSFAVEQQRKAVEVLWLPARNRTPWDAGGYSLPFNSMNTIKSPIPLSENIHRASSEFIHRNTDDSQISGTLNSPIHKFTDSRSSLSSFTSSIPSTTHSRLSSISTVNSTHTLSHSLASQSLSPKSATHQLVEMSSSLPSDGDTRPITITNEPQTRDESSPTKSLDALALIAEHHHTGNLPESSSPTMMSREGEHQRVMHSPSNRGLAFRDATFQGNIDDNNEMHSHHVVPGKNQKRAENVTFGDNDNDMGGQEVRAGEKNIEGRSWINGKNDMSNLEVGDSKNDTESKSWVNAQERSTSPSDTLLIMRTTTPTLHVNTREQTDQSHSLHQQQPRLHVRTDSGFRIEKLEDTKYHQRAVSAPNFAVQQTIALMADQRRRGRQAEHTSPSSQHPDRSSPTLPFGYSAPATPPPAAVDDSEGEPVCMYITDCDTGSQQRKAISHIFGRNKMCTRLVPQHIWVHLCRKHYQRSRYRNATAGYAKVQCDLVQEQIRRIHDWSVRNLNSGHGPFVQNWTLALRKREKKRIEEQDGPKRKRSTFVQDEDDIVHRDEVGYPAPQTAVPDWLLALVGGDFTTRGVLEVFNRLHRHIMDFTVPFPDIEILPNIVLGQDDSKQPSTKNLHQRTQSLSVSHESRFRDHVSKRRRQNKAFPSDQKLPSSSMARQPTYPNIHEHEAEGNGHYYQRPSYQSPLAAPTPQRLNSQSMAAHLEANNARSVDRRPAHHRSQSDVSGFTRDSSNRSRYLERRMSKYHQSRHSQSYGRGGTNNISMYSQPLPKAYRATMNTLHPGARVTNQTLGYHIDPPIPSAADVSQSPSMGHARHYSSPMTSRSSYSTSPVATSSNQYLSLLTSSQSDRPLSSASKIRETKQTRDLYSSKR